MNYFASWLQKLPGNELPQSDWEEQVEALRVTQPWSLIRRYLRTILVGVFFLLVTRVCLLAIPFATKYLLDNVLMGGQFNKLTGLTLVTSILVGIQIVAGMATMKAFAETGQRGVTELRTILYRHICHLPLEFHDRDKTGSILSRIMNDLDGVRWFIGTGLAELLGASASTVIALVVMVKISLFLTTIALAFLALFGGFFWFVFVKSRTLHMQHSSIRGQITGRLAESLAGIRVTKAYCAELAECSAMHTGFTRLGAITLKVLNLHFLMNAQSMALFSVANIVFLWVGSSAISSKALSIGSFVLFLTISNSLSGNTLQMISSSKQINEALAGLKRMHEIVKIPREGVNPQSLLSLSNVRGELCFEDVSFQYSDGQQILEGISFSATPGSVTAIVGSSGSGKTTIANLAAGFYRPTAGKIYLDGLALEAIALKSYRRILGLVLQDSFLFDGTIRENIAFSRPEATQEEIEEAAQIAYVDEFVHELQHGYDTLVGERGIKLSAGQRQRISVARAILAQPRILILDEATSNLDSESEVVIQKALGKLMKEVTAIVIAHRLSTVRHADQILVLEEGHIIERGTHESLWALRGRYFDLCRKQHSEELERSKNISPIPELASIPGGSPPGF